MSIEEDILECMKSMNGPVTADVIWEGIDRVCTREELNKHLHAMTEKSSTLFRKPNMGGKGFFYSVKPFPGQTATAQPAPAAKAPAPEPVVAPEPETTETKAAEANASPRKIERSMEGLRELLFSTLEGMRDGTVEPKKAAVTATVAQAILKSAEVQIEFHKAAKSGTIPGGFSRMLLTNNVVNP